MSFSPNCAALLATAAFAPALSAQSFQNNTSSIPQGSTFNGGSTENVELCDLDLDGDLDLVWANGGAAGNEQSRLWLNRGGAQGGAPGTFDDDTAARTPALLASSRDVDFVDLERDGDLDLFLSNSSGIANQSNRIWINMGGAQGGSPGYFQDRTATHWNGLGINDGSTQCSSIAPQLVLPSGGFIDWSCDSAVGDLDLDGQLDLVQSSYGALTSGRVPTRMFLNDGAGVWRELNPSCHQLVGTDITQGAPALWCEGVHVPASSNASGAQCDISADLMALELGDLDLDFDLDLLRGNKFGPPRVFDNRLDAGALIFRDVTYAIAAQNWAPGNGNYDQELGDMDDDGDLDIYGVNWVAINDAQLFNDGDGTFAPGAVVPHSLERQIEADFFDHDADGDLDVLVVSETVDEYVYVNPGAAGGWLYALDPSAIPPQTASAQGADVGDVDRDGDTDALVATLFFEPNVLYENVTQHSDTFAPRSAPPEQAPDRAAGALSTIVRAHVLDNAAWYRNAFNSVELQFKVDGGPWSSTSMRWSGGQLFRGEIPGALVGLVEYRVAASDEYGNTGVSLERSYLATPCDGAVQAYCTAKLNSAGCVPSVIGVGSPSATAPVPFRIKARDVINNKAGLLFYGLAADATPYLGGLRCVQPPVRRTQLQNSDGNPPPNDCSGMLSFDFNEHIRSGTDASLIPGAQVFAQFWYRDPQSSHASGLTDALRFSICP